MNARSWSSLFQHTLRKASSDGGPYVFETHTYEVGPEDGWLGLGSLSFTAPLADTSPLDTTLATTSGSSEHQRLVEYPVSVSGIDELDAVTVTVEGEESFEVEPVQAAGLPSSEKWIRFYTPEKNEAGSYNLTVSAETDEEEVNDTVEDAITYEEIDDEESLLEFNAATSSEAFFTNSSAEITASLLGAEAVTDADVVAEVERPDNSTVAVDLEETRDGYYRGTVQLSEEDFPEEELENDTIVGEYEAEVSASDDEGEELPVTDDISWEVGVHSPITVEQTDTPEVLPGETAEGFVEVNSEMGARGVYLGVSDLGLTEPWTASISSEYVEIEESHLVSPSGPGFAEYSIEVPEDTDPGHYQGNLAGYISDGEASVVDELRVDVLQPPTFHVEIDRDATEEFVLDGETLEVHAEITNQGDVEGVQNIELQGIENETKDSHVLSLEPDESENLLLELDTEEGEPGVGDVTVITEDRRDSVEVTIGEPAEFEVRETDTTEPTLYGETLHVDAELQNTGDVEGRQDILLLDEDGEIDSAELELQSDERDTASLTWTADEVGETTLVVESEDDSTEVDVRVAGSEADLLRTAIQSIPDRGYRPVQVAEQREKVLLLKVSQFEQELEVDDDIAGAIHRLEQDLRPKITQWVSEGYTAEHGFEMERHEVLETVDSASERLRDLCEQRSHPGQGVGPEQPPGLENTPASWQNGFPGEGPAHPRATLDCPDEYQPPVDDRITTTDKGDSGESDSVEDEAEDGMDGHDRSSSSGSGTTASAGTVGTSTSSDTIHSPDEPIEQESEDNKVDDADTEEEEIHTEDEDAETDSNQTDNEAISPSEANENEDREPGAIKTDEGEVDYEENSSGVPNIVKRLVELIAILQ